MKKNFKMILAGGGTGGHLFSGIAMAELIKAEHPEAEVLFVGTPYGLEKEIVPQAGFNLNFIKVSPLKGTGWLWRVKTLLQLPQAFLQSRKILKEFKPDIVLGIGGYASGPMLLAAHFQKCFTAIIEQNAYPGFTNRTLARYVDKIFIAYDKALDFFDPQKTFLTGNPIRTITPNTDWQTKAFFTIFVLGGSQGARSLNQAMIQALPKLKNQTGVLKVIHQTGKNDFHSVEASYKKQGISAKVFPFTQNLSDYYAQTDLLICRAGAGTLSEVKLCGLPSILVPYPYAADNHQYFNAKEMEEKGAAEIILDQDLTGDKLADRIQYYREHPQTLHSMSAVAQTLAKPNAAREVLEQCLLNL